MTLRLPVPPVLVVTDRMAAKRSLEDITADVFKAGCKWLMVREKDLNSDDLLELTAPIVDQGRQHGAVVEVNGNIHVALRTCAHGVHIQDKHKIYIARKHLPEKALIGVSTHSFEDALNAQAAGADYVTLSPIFVTESKPGYGPAIGLNGLSSICRNLDVPVVALAGIDASNAKECILAGASGVAVMGSIMRASDTILAVESILDAL